MCEQVAMVEVFALLRRYAALGGSYPSFGDSQSVPTGLLKDGTDIVPKCR